MKREEFLAELRKSLAGLPKEDIEDRINFYDESISDRMEDGKTEEEAIADIGSVDDVVKEIAKKTPMTTLVKEKIRPKRKLSGWEILVLALGFPLWFPLLLTFFILVLVGILLIWIGVIVSYSVEIALVGSFFTGIAASTASMLAGEPNILYFGIILSSLGLAIFLGFGCVGIVKATAKLSKNIILGIKSWFIKKGDNN